MEFSTSFSKNLPHLFCENRVFIIIWGAGEINLAGLKKKMVDKVSEKFPLFNLFWNLVDYHFCILQFSTLIQGSWYLACVL